MTNLQCHGPYPDMSKAFLWKLMKINMYAKFYVIFAISIILLSYINIDYKFFNLRLNTLLRDLQAETSQTLYVNFPAMTLHESPVIIKLLLRNVTAVIASWNIKRVQLCSCRPVSKGFSLQRAKYDCLHRKVCSIQPKTGKLKVLH